MSPDWDERFRSGSYPLDPMPSPLLEAYIDQFPDGRALDIAAGTGRNAVFLAAEGYTVDAIDASRPGMEIARSNARTCGVDDRINWVQADAFSHVFRDERYDVITISYFRCLDRFTDLTDALIPGGYFFVEHHIRTPHAVQSGPRDDRHRFGVNELLRACLGLTVLYYDEGIEEPSEDGSRATARILARKSTGSAQAVPNRV